MFRPSSFASVRSLSMLAAGVTLAVVVAACGSGAGEPEAGGTGTTATASGDGATDYGEPQPGGVPPLHVSIDDYPETVVQIHTASGVKVFVDVKIADTPERRQHGFMEVPHIPDGVGMLFTYDEDHTGGFWMRNTLVPLAIAYIAADGTIVDIRHMEPCPPDADSCPSYPPDEPYRRALEVPEGWFADAGVAEGDRVVRICERPSAGDAGGGDPVGFRQRGVCSHRTACALTARCPSPAVTGGAGVALV